MEKIDKENTKFHEKREAPTKSFKRTKMQEP